MKSKYRGSSSAQLLLQIVKKSQAGGGVAVKIEHAVYQSAKMFGRHFDDKDEIISHISRTSIDVLKVRYCCTLDFYLRLTVRAIVNLQSRCLDGGVGPYQKLEACECLEFIVTAWF